MWRKDHQNDPYDSTANQFFVNLLTLSYIGQISRFFFLGPDTYNHHNNFRTYARFITFHDLIAQFNQDYS